MDTYDFEIIQGSTFALTVSLTDSNSVPIDLTSYNVSGFLKYKFSDAQKLANLNATKSSPYDSGVITLSLPATGTAILPVTIARYDIEIYHTGLGTVDKILLGEVTISPEATK